MRIQIYTLCIYGLVLFPVEAVTFLPRPAHIWQGIAQQMGECYTKRESLSTELLSPLSYGARMVMYLGLVPRQKPLQL